MSFTMEKDVEGAKVIYDVSKKVRWVDAFGETVVKHVLNPGEAVPVDDTTGDPTGFVMTVTEVGDGTTTAANSETVGEALLITTAANEYDGINLQAKNVAFKCEADKPMYFGIKCIADEATQNDLLVGLCTKDTDILAVETTHGITDDDVEGIFFFKADGGTVLQFKTYKDGSETNSAKYATAMGVIAAVYEFYWDGTDLKAYIDNNHVATFTTGMPDTELVPTINYRAGSAVARTLSVYWMRTFEIRAA